MTQSKTAPYGSWKSPITTDLIVANTVALGQIEIDGSDVYWVETRPEEAGRNVVVRRTSDGAVSDVTPAPFNVRSTVHEYGGGAFSVSDGMVLFSNFADQLLYRQDAGSTPRPITSDTGLRYADGAIDGRRGLMFCVREDHTTEGQEAVNTIVAVKVDGDADGGRVLVSGGDFYASPRLSPDGTRLAWVTWDHPNMPWDGTEIWVGELDAAGSVVGAEKVAGAADESAVDPVWGPDGTLYFTSDRTGWYNVYRWAGGEATALAGRPAEFSGRPGALGTSTLGAASNEKLVCAYTHGGGKTLALLDTAGGALEIVDLPYTEIAALRVASGRAYVLAGSPALPSSIVGVDLETGRHEVLRRSSELAVDAGYLSAPEAIEFPTEGGLTAHAYYYAPTNRDHHGPGDGRPPLIVKSHGGPVGATSTTLDLSTQFWTSRGFALVDVNYGGSTGYGRKYRRRLIGEWGVVDVDDCINAAKYLVDRGDVDGERVAIRGGSAGGYTTLASLAFRDFYNAGASHYGISELEAMTQDTHKFESRYLDGLIGPYPERIDLYRERSPLYAVDRLSCPLILFQGLEDKVVPPNQAELMFEALRAKKLPVAYVPFEGEQHGFRQAKNIKRALEGELYFYSQVFGFDLAEPVDPVPIENL